MKTIFLGEAARDSGSFGFSDAWPLFLVSPVHIFRMEKPLPASPHSMHVHSFCNIHNHFHVGVVVVIGTTFNLDVVVRHSDIISIGLKVLGSSHHGEVNGPLIAKYFVCPFPHRADLLDGSDTIVRDQDL